MAHRKNIVPVSRAGVRTTDKVRPKRTRSTHGRKGTRRARPGGMPYQPKQCTKLKKNQERCKMKVVKGTKTCQHHAEDS